MANINDLPGGATPEVPEVDTPETPETPDTPETPENPETPERPEESDEDRLTRLERQTKQLRKKLGKTDEPEKKSSKGKEKGELDYGQKAFLVANGIKGNGETALVQQIMAETGKDLDTTLESKYFQAELKSFRENQAALAAIPNGKNRTGNSQRDSVDYWLAKGELPPADQVQLRRDVLNKRIEKEKVKNTFSANPIVQN